MTTTQQKQVVTSSAQSSMATTEQTMDPAPSHDWSTCWTSHFPLCEVGEESGSRRHANLDSGAGWMEASKNVADATGALPSIQKTRGLFNTDEHFGARLELDKEAPNSQANDVTGKFDLIGLFEDDALASLTSADQSVLDFYLLGSLPGGDVHHGDSGEAAILSPVTSLPSLPATPEVASADFLEVFTDLSAQIAMEYMVEEAQPGACSSDTPMETLSMEDLAVIATATALPEAITNGPLPLQCIPALENVVPTGSLPSPSGRATLKRKCADTSVPIDTGGETDVDSIGDDAQRLQVARESVASDHDYSRKAPVVPPSPKRARRTAVTLAVTAEETTSGGSGSLIETAAAMCDVFSESCEDEVSVFSSDSISGGCEAARSSMATTPALADTSDDLAATSPRDSKYRQRRDKNNIASRRSRYTRKEKYVQMEERAVELEKENRELEKRVEKMEALAKVMKEALVKMMAGKGAGAQ